MPAGVEPNLWAITNNKLNESVDNVFGKVNYNHPDAHFISELKHNNGVFSAFKTHKQTKELAALMRNKEGGLKSFGQFKKDSEAVIGKYNKQWLNTEYNTAVRSARNAANFKKYQATAELYPNLEYTPSRSANPRQQHKVFYHMVLPIVHPFWETHTPPLDWECKCGITNTDAEAVEEVPVTNLYVAPGLDNNPAISNKLFADSHPYYGGVSKKQHKAITQQAGSLMTPYQKKYIFDWSKSAIHQYKGLKLSAENLASKKALLTRGSVSEIFAHTTDPVVRKYIPQIPNDFKNWKYLGWATVKEGKHKEAVCFMYYEVVVGDKKRYVNVKLHKHFKTEVPYAIYDSIDFSTIRSGERPPNIKDYM